MQIVITRTTRSLYRQQNGEARWYETKKKSNATWSNWTVKTYLNSRLQGQEGIARIGHLEDTSKPILRKVANFENLQVGGHGAEVELADKNVIDNDGRFRILIEGLCQEIARTSVEVGVGRQRRPVEVEGHVEMASTLSKP